MKLAVLLTISALAVSACCFDIDCDYSRNDQWTEVNYIYYCAVQNHLTGMSMYNKNIDRANGHHSWNKNDYDVYGFWVQNTEMEHFPQNLDRVFPNLKAIGIQNSGMQEIRRDDLQPFGSRLIYFRLSGCNIDNIERDLFMHNTGLKVVGLDDNKIKTIDGGAFDRLSLNHLWLKGNECINENAENFYDVNNVIEKVKTQCRSPRMTHYSSWGQTIDDLSNGNYNHGYNNNNNNNQGYYNNNNNNGMNNCQQQIQQITQQLNSLKHSCGSNRNEYYN